jgi:hypothetical protein
MNVSGRYQLVSCHATVNPFGDFRPWYLCNWIVSDGDKGP